MRVDLIDIVILYLYNLSIKCMVYINNIVDYSYFYLKESEEKCK